MWRYITISLFILYIGISPAWCIDVSHDNISVSNNKSSDNWVLVSSEDVFWIKTINAQHHTLMFSSNDNKSQLDLILKKHMLKTDVLSSVNNLAVNFKIDRGNKQSIRVIKVDGRSGNFIVRMDIAKNDNLLLQLINGLNISFSINFLSEKISKNISFSLKGFTVALNDLIIADEIGSLQPEWLLQHKKDRELYCLLTTEISIEVMQYRLDGESYNAVLQRISKTGYSLIDHNLGEIIEQVFNIPKEKIAYIPRAEKYRLFRNCMAQPF